MNKDQEEKNQLSPYHRRATDQQVKHIRHSLSKPRLNAEQKENLVLKLSRQHHLHPIYIAKIATGKAHHRVQRPRGVKTGYLSSKRLPNNKNTIRQTIGTQQEWRCVYCFKDIHQNSTMDHIIPFAKGGTKTKDNLQLTCRKCNNSKATMSDHDFRTTINRQDKLVHVTTSKNRGYSPTTPFRFAKCSCTIHGCYPGCNGCELCSHYHSDIPARPACPNGPTPPYPCSNPQDCHASKACRAATT